MVQIPTVEESEGRAEQLDFFASEEAKAERATWLRHELDLVPAPEFAAALGVAEQTLASWRSESSGPPYVKIGKTVFYRRELLKTWIRAQEHPRKAAA